MAFFNRLAFWKKEGPAAPQFPDLNLGNPISGFDDRTGLPSALEPEFGKEQLFEQRGESPFSAEVMGRSRSVAPNAPRGFPVQDNGLQSYAVAKDIEVVSSKLDALRAGLESINQRLAHLERIAEGEQDTRRRWRY
ncbi:MAG TPA: hypothetical protein VJC16_07445 [Candidatus Nanoarchaeia archaeon]|nr:hypothetical protein [Candidatus Nanoarchaeia archaeon]